MYDMLKRCSLHLSFNFEYKMCDLQVSIHVYGYIVWSHLHWRPQLMLKGIYPKIYWWYTKYVFYWPIIFNMKNKWWFKELVFKNVSCSNQVCIWNKWLSTRRRYENSIHKNLYALLCRLYFEFSTDTLTLGNNSFNTIYIHDFDETGIPVL